MVALHSVWNMHNLTVHLVTLSLLAFCSRIASDSVKLIAGWNGTPFVLVELIIIIGVNYGVFAA